LPLCNSKHAHRPWSRFWPKTREQAKADARIAPGWLPGFLCVPLEAGHERYGCVPLGL
jgi:hypothetical protein